MGMLILTPACKLLNYAYMYIYEVTLWLSINNLQSNQVKHTPQDYINKSIIWILNPLDYSFQECNNK